MAVSYILSTDKLQSGFRAKYNLSVAEIITAFTDNNNGTVTALQFDGTTLTINLTGSFFTKAEITALFAGISPTRNPVEYEYTQANLVEDGAGSGNWYLPYRTPSGAPIADGIRPYSIASSQGPHEYGIPPIIENDNAWTEPRIYGFTNVAQTITIFAL